MARAAKNCDATLGKRHGIATAVAKMSDDGLDVESIFFGDESRIDQDCDGRFNPQDESNHYSQATKKDDVLPGQEKAKEKRPAGIMAHLTVSSRGGRRYT